MNVKIKSLMVFLIIIGFLIIPVSAEPLIEIVEPDSWIYDFEQNALYPKLNAETEINYTVIGTEFYGGDVQIKLNLITPSEFLEETELNNLAGNNYVLLETTGVGGTITLRFTSLTINTDILYRTTRGNLLYNRITDLTVGINFSNIEFGGIPYDDFYEDFTITLVETSDTPEIISCVSDGLSYINTRNFMGVTVEEISLGGGMEVHFAFIYTRNERYSASDTFIYDNTECRNITIEPITENRVTMSFSRIGSFSFDTDFIIPPNYVENWIYAYNVGLPLLVEKTTYINESLVPKNTQTAEPADNLLYKMTLKEYNLTNSDGTTNVGYEWFFLMGLFMVASLLMYQSKKIFS